MNAKADMNVLDQSNRFFFASPKKKWWCVAKKETVVWFLIRATPGGAKQTYSAGWSKARATTLAFSYITIAC